MLTLSDQSMWLDEVATAHVVSGSLGQAVDRFLAAETAPPLYYAFLWLWAQLGGTDDLTLRLPSALAGLGTVGVVYATARSVASEWAGLAAASFAAVSPLLVWYSQEARAYSLLVFLCALSLHFFLEARDGDSRSLNLWALFSSLALLTHYVAAPLVIFEAAWLIAGATRRLALPRMVPVAATGMALIPLAYEQRGHLDWLAGIPLRDRLEQVGETFALGLSDPPVWTLAALALLAALAAGLALGRRRPGPSRGVLAIAGAAAAFSLALPIAMALFGRDFVLTRSLLPAYVPLLLLVALVLAEAPRRWGSAIAVALCLFWGGISVATQSDPALQRPDWKSLGASLRRASEDRLVVAPGERNQALPLLRYLPAVRLLRPEERARVGEIIEVNFADPKVAACGLWVAARCGSTRVSVPDGGGFRRHPSSRIGLFSVTRLTAPRPLTGAFDWSIAFFQAAEGQSPPDKAPPMG